jgi:chromosomal replication initiation ATPase DnaA
VAAFRFYKRVVAPMKMRAGAPQDVVMDDRETVAAIRARLADRVGKERYDIWFGPETHLVLRGDTLLVSARDQFFQDWLRLNFRKDLEVIAEEVLGKSVSLEFHITVASHERRPGRDSVQRPSCQAACGVAWLHGRKCEPKQ